MTDKVDVTRSEFAAMEATVRDMMAILQRYQSDLEMQFKRMSALQSDLIHLHSKIRY